MKKENQWLVLMHQITPKSDSFRVKIWRSLQKTGALQLKNSVYVLPYTKENQQKFEQIVTDIVEQSGDAFLCQSQFVKGIKDDEIILLFNSDRSERYQAIAKELRPLQKLFSKKERPPENDLMIIEHSLGKLERQLAEIRNIDFFNSAHQVPTQNLMNGFLSKVRALRGNSFFEKIELMKPKDFQNKTWVTRSNIKIDRLASAWLIDKFIDKNPKFKFVSESNYKPLKNEVRFDMFDAEFTHIDDKCTFEVLVESFLLAADAIRTISEIIHDLDLNDTKYNHPETAGIGIVLKGVIENDSSDSNRIKKAKTLFDDLYTTL